MISLYILRFGLEITRLVSSFEKRGSSLEPENIVDVITTAKEDWREKVSAVVAELSGESLKDIVDKLLKGLESDEKFLLAAMRLASVPIVASSYPELVFGIVDYIRDLKDAT